MTILLMFVHVLACFFLIAVVLLQSGKGAEMGAAFGGSSQTLFGSRGASSFLSKMTTVAAVVFMLTSLTLAVVTTRGSSVVKKVPQAEEGKSVPGPIQGVLPQPQTKQLPQPSQPAQQKAAQAPHGLKPQKQQNTTQTQPQTPPAPQTTPVTAQQPQQPTQEPQQPPTK